jgi:hypothetical protein
MILGARRFYTTLYSNRKRVDLRHGAPQPEDEDSGSGGVKEPGLAFNRLAPEVDFAHFKFV